MPNEQKAAQAIEWVLKLAKNWSIKTKELKDIILEEAFDALNSKPTWAKEKNIIKWVWLVLHRILSASWTALSVEWSLLSELAEETKKQVATDPIVSRIIKLHDWDLNDFDYEDSEPFPNGIWPKTLQQLRVLWIRNNKEFRSMMESWEKRRILHDLFTLYGWPSTPLLNAEKTMTAWWSPLQKMPDSTIITPEKTTSSADVTNKEEMKKIEWWYTEIQKDIWSKISAPAKIYRNQYKDEIDPKEYAQVLYAQCADIWKKNNAAEVIAEPCYTAYRDKVVAHFNDIQEAFDTANPNWINFTNSEVDIRVEGDELVYTIRTPSWYTVNSADLKVRNASITSIHADIMNWGPTPVDSFDDTVEIRMKKSVAMDPSLTAAHIIPTMQLEVLDRDPDGLLHMPGNETIFKPKVTLNATQKKFDEFLKRKLTLVDPQVEAGIDLTKITSLPTNIPIKVDPYATVTITQADPGRNQFRDTSGVAIPHIQGVADQNGQLSLTLPANIERNYTQIAMTATHASAWASKVVMKKIKLPPEVVTVPESVSIINPNSRSITRPLWSETLKVEWLGPINRNNGTLILREHIPITTAWTPVATPTVYHRFPNLQTDSYWKIINMPSIDMERISRLYDIVVSFPSSTPSDPDIQDVFTIDYTAPTETVAPEVPASFDFTDVTDRPNTVGHEERSPNTYIVSWLTRPARIRVAGWFVEINGVRHSQASLDATPHTMVENGDKVVAIVETSDDHNQPRSVTVKIAETPAIFTATTWAPSPWEETPTAFTFPDLTDQPTGERKHIWRTTLAWLTGPVTLHIPAWLEVIRWLATLSDWTKVSQGDTLDFYVTTPTTHATDMPISFSIWGLTRIMNIRTIDAPVIETASITKPISRNITGTTGDEKIEVEGTGPKDRNDGVLSLRPRGWTVAAAHVTENAITTDNTWKITTLRSFDMAWLATGSYDIVLTFPNPGWTPVEVRREVEYTAPTPDTQRPSVSTPAYNQMYTPWSKVQFTWEYAWTEAMVWLQRENPVWTGTWTMIGWPITLTWSGTNKKYDIPLDNIRDLWPHRYRVGPVNAAGAMIDPDDRASVVDIQVWTTWITTISRPTSPIAANLLSRRFTVNLAWVQWKEAIVRVKKKWEPDTAYASVQRQLLTGAATDPVVVDTILKHGDYIIQADIWWVKTDRELNIPAAPVIITPILNVAWAPTRRHARSPIVSGRWEPDTEWDLIVTQNGREIYKGKVKTDNQWNWTHQLKNVGTWAVLITAKIAWIRAERSINARANLNDAPRINTKRINVTKNTKSVKISWYWEKDGINTVMVVDKNGKSYWNLSVWERGAFSTVRDRARNVADFELFWWSRRKVNSFGGEIWVWWLFSDDTLDQLYVLPSTATKNTDGTYDVANAGVVNIQRETTRWEEAKNVWAGAVWLMPNALMKNKTQREAYEKLTCTIDAVDGIVKKNSIPLTGTWIAWQKVKIYSKNAVGYPVLKSAVTVKKDGTWSSTASFPKDGNYTYIAQAYDPDTRVYGPKAKMPISVELPTSEMTKPSWLSPLKRWKYNSKEKAENSTTSWKKKETAAESAATSATDTEKKSGEGKKNEKKSREKPLNNFVKSFWNGFVNLANGQSVEQATGYKKKPSWPIATAVWDVISAKKKGAKSSK